MRELVDSGEVFHPLRWSPKEAHRLLHDIPVLEESGVLARVPDWWSKRPPRVRVSIGDTKSSRFGVDSMLDFQAKMTLEGDALSDDEWQSILAGLVQLPGNRHDVNGVYALLKTAFKGTLIGDSAYQPNPTERAKLNHQGIRVHAIPKSNATLPLAPVLINWLKERRTPIERRIGLFDRQFHAGRTLNRTERHYRARRFAKALAHNISRHINVTNDWPQERVAYFRYAA